MSHFDLDRRDLLKLIGYLVSADILPAQHNSVWRPPDDYKPRFFTSAEYELATQLCELIIPSDSESPGASEAGVPWFIDTILLYADAKRQNVWRSGLFAVDALSVRLRAAPFLRCSPPDRLQVVEYMAQQEDAPNGGEQPFFKELKAVAVQAFCLSDLGMRNYLHYRGNVALSQFPGCPTSTTASS
jgi:hypothetical protein